MKHTIHQNKIAFDTSYKQDGVMNIIIDNIANGENRKNFFTQKGIDIENVTIAKLVHGNNIVLVDEENNGQIIKNTDGLATNKKGSVLAVTFADCLPIFFYDSKNKAIGIAHAGWRGVEKNIAGKMIDFMVEKFKSNPKDIVIYIGPYLQKCHFEVQEDIVDRFSKYPKAIIRKDKKLFIDLGAVVVEQCTDKKVEKKNIEITSECTFCEKDKYFSYRRDKPELVQSQIAYIYLK
jgi:polyphenol oxidase